MATRFHFKWWLLTASFAACVPLDDPPPRDASPDAADSPGDTRTAPDAEADSVGPAEVGSEPIAFIPRADPRQAGLCDGAPADLRGAVLHADPEGVWLGAREEMSLGTAARVLAFEPGTVPRSPVVFAGGAAPSEPAAAIAVDTPGGAELLVLDAFGAPTAELSFGGVSSLPPLAGARYLAWPLQEPDRGAGRIVWVDLVTGQPIHSLELDVAPTSAPMLLPRELASGGGSHWLVGTARGLLIVRDPLQDARLDGPPADPAGDDAPAIAARRDDAPAPVVQLVGVGHRVLLVPHAEEGLAPGLQLASISRDASGLRLDLAAPDIELPGPVTAHPVAWSCDRLDAWYCTRSQGGLPPEGALVLAGAGWLEVRAIPSGARLAAFDAPVLWTGLALGREGWIAGGGSHWLPGDGLGRGWTLMALHPDAPSPAVLGSGDEDACVPSPLWDVDGTLALPLPGGADEIFRSAVPSFGGDLAGGTGAPRPFGGAMNDGRAVDASRSCVGSDTRGVSSIALDSREVRGLVAGYGSLLVHGSLGGQASVTWLDDGRDTIGLLLPDATEVSHAVMRASSSVVVVHDDVAEPGTVWIRRVDAQAATAWSRRVPVVGAPVVGLARLGDSWVALEWGGERAVLHRFADDGTPLDGRDLGTELAGNASAMLRGLPEGALALEPAVFLAADDGDGAEIRRLGADLSDAGAFRWSYGSPGALTGLSADATGQVRAVVEAIGPAEGSAVAEWLHLDATLGLVSTRPLPAAGALATRPEGDSLIVGPAGHLRISAADALGLPRRVEALGPHPNLAAATAAGFVAAGEATSGTTRTFLWAETDLAGLASCAAVGLCVSVAPEACDDASACTMSGCAPSTGECAVTSVPLCMSP